MPRRATAGGLLSLPVNPQGYRFARLHKYGRVTVMTAGSIVLRTFRGPPGPDQRARHGPGGKADDSLQNLWWG